MLSPSLSISPPFLCVLGQLLGQLACGHQHASGFVTLFRRRRPLRDDPLLEPARALPETLTVVDAVALFDTLAPPRASLLRIGLFKLLFLYIDILSSI